MEKAALKHYILHPGRLLLAGFILLLMTSSCGGIIEVVPFPTPTVTPDPAADTSLSGPAVPDHIKSEAIGLDAPVVEMGWRQTIRWGQVVSEWNIPSYGAAWHRNSARPGEGSNIVISGHNNSMGGRVFARLEELAVGDKITLQNKKGEAFIYQIDEKELVRTFGASADTEVYLQAVLEPTQQEQLTLITCWPSWSNTHRLIVVAKPL